MFATYVRSSKIGERVIYFGPMGCQTGFYLLVRQADNREVLSVVIDTLEKIVAHEGEIFGKARRECGNFENLDITAAKREAERYLKVLCKNEWDFIYKE
jgi:S-ribosylhomocysteine lyase